MKLVSGKKIRFVTSPKMKLHMVENTNQALKVLWRPDLKEYRKIINLIKICIISISLQVFKDDGLKLVNVSGEDIEGMNTTITLGLIWSLILKYQISKALEVRYLYKKIML
jgi:hypothetical protein